MQTRYGWTTRAALATGLVFASRASSARADAGFALQPAIVVATAVEPLTSSTASPSGLPREAFAMVPALRLGVALPSVLILGYGSNSNAGVQGHAVSGVTRVGLVVEPVIWRSDDARVGIYLLGGGGVIAMAGATVTTDATMTTTAKSFVATGETFQFGVGGWYAVHPSFAVGLELAVQPDFVSVDSGRYVGDQAIVSLTGTFVAAEHALSR